MAEKQAFHSGTKNGVRFPCWLHKQQKCLQGEFPSALVKREHQRLMPLAIYHWNAYVIAKRILTEEQQQKLHTDKYKQLILNVHTFCMQRYAIPTLHVFINGNNEKH